MLRSVIPANALCGAFTCPRSLQPAFFTVLVSLFADIVIAEHNTLLYYNCQVIFKKCNKINWDLQKLHNRQV